MVHNAYDLSFALKSLLHDKLKIYSWHGREVVGGQKQLEIHQMFTGEVDFSNFYFHISFCYYFLVALQWPCIDERVKKQNMFFWNNAPSVTAFLRYLSTDSIQIFPASRPLPYTPDPLLSGLLSSYPSPSLSSGCDFSSPLKCSSVSSSCWLSLSQFPDQSRAE